MLEAVEGAQGMAKSANEKNFLVTKTRMIFFFVKLSIILEKNSPKKANICD